MYLKNFFVFFQNFIFHMFLLFGQRQLLSAIDFVQNIVYTINFITPCKKAKLNIVKSF